MKFSLFNEDGAVVQISLAGKKITVGVSRKMFSVLLVDDEVASLRYLRNLITSFSPSFEVVAECENGRDALSVLHETRRCTDHRCENADYGRHCTGERSEACIPICISLL